MLFMEFQVNLQPLTIYVSIYVRNGLHLFHATPSLTLSLSFSFTVSQM